MDRGAAGRVLTPPIEAVVLAAGASARMAPHHKLWATGADGRSLLAHSLDALAVPAVRRVHVVVAQGVAAPRLSDPRMSIVVCAEAAAGMAHSLRAGLAALGPGTAAVLVALGDMPRVRAATVAALLAAWQPGLVVAPSHQGRRGNPVLWCASLVPQLMTLSGDRGARDLLADLGAQLRLLPCPDPGVLIDADTPAALRAVPGGPWRAADGRPI